MDPVSSREVFDLLVRVFEEVTDPDDKVCIALSKTLTETIKIEHIHEDARETRAAYERQRSGGGPVAPTLPDFSGFGEPN